MTVDGVRLHYVSAGRGQPVVLLHGDGGSALDFTMSQLFDLLAESFHVVAFDRPGHGFSDAGEEADTLAGQADLLYSAVAALGLTDSVLVGHSRGGSVMAAYLDRHPEEVAAAVSLGGALLAEGPPPPYTPYRPGVWPLVGPALVGTVYVPAVRFGDYRLLRDSLDHAFAPEGPAPDDYVRAYACRWVSPATIATTYRLAQDTYRALPEVSRRYPGLEVPLAIVHGDADQSVDPDQAIRVHAVVPGSRLHVLDGAGHEPQFTRPDLVANVIAELSPGQQRIAPTGQPRLADEPR